MSKRHGSVMSGALATLVVASVLMLREIVTADPVLGSSVLDRVPSTVLADEPDGVLVAISGSSYGPFGFGGSSFGAVAQVLDADGHTLRTVHIGESPSHALVDPRTGHLIVLTATSPNPSSATAFGASGTYLSVVDPASGMLLRTIAIQQPPAMGFGGFGGGGGGFGRGPIAPPTLWQQAYRYAAPPRRGGGALALDADRRRIFVGGAYTGGTGQAGLVVLDADSGAPLRTIPMPAAVSAVAVDPTAARVVVADQSGGITLLDARTLRPVGSLAGSGIAAQIAIDERRGRAFVLNASVGTVTTVDTRRGRLLGVASVGSGASAIQVDEQTGHVFVESTGLSGFAFWRTGNQTAGPSAGTVAMLDAGSGRVLRSITVGTLPFSAALDDRHHQLFVSSFGTDTAAVSGAVQVIDTASGHVARTIQVPAGPISLALDSSRGHVVVAGLGDDSQLPGPWTGAVERVVQFFGLAGPTPTPSGPGAVAILKTAH